MYKKTQGNLGGLGQMRFKFPWKKNFLFIGYFALYKMTRE